MSHTENLQKWNIIAPFQCLRFHKEIVCTCIEHPQVWVELNCAGKLVKPSWGVAWGHLVTDEPGGLHYNTACHIWARIWMVRSKLSFNPSILPNQFLVWVKSDQIQDLDMRADFPQRWSPTTTTLTSLSSIITVSDSQLASWLASHNAHNLTMLKSTGLSLSSSSFFFLPLQIQSWNE